MQNGDVIEDSFEFEFLKSFSSQTVDPIDDPFSPLAYSRRDLRNYIPCWHVLGTFFHHQLPYYYHILTGLS
jgi:hypothetical protein